MGGGVSNTTGRRGGMHRARFAEVVFKGFQLGRNQQQQKRVGVVQHLDGSRRRVLLSIAGVEREVVVDRVKASARRRSARRKNSCVPTKGRMACQWSSRNAGYVANAW